MKKLLKKLKSKYWWIFSYKKYKLTDLDAHKGRCLQCEGGTFKPGNLRCGYGNGCPCKWNECLKKRK